MQVSNTVPNQHDFDEEKRKMNQEFENEKRELRIALNEQKDIVRKLYGVIVRSMVVLKQIIRLGAVVGTYFLFGPVYAYWLAGFIAVVGVFQLAIDKTRRIVYPELKLSEWDVL